jgi:hypothetical protein
LPEGVLANTEGGREEGDPADLDPVRNLATLTGADDRDVLCWFILVVAMLRDPVAVLLSLAARRRGGSATCAGCVNGCCKRN